MKFAGGHRIRVTPVPIPNTEVKPATADGTAWETVWESRSLPALSRARELRFAGVRLYAGAWPPHTVSHALHGLHFLGRLACSAAVWESRPAAGIISSPRT